MFEYQERLRSIALSDDRFVASVLGMSQLALGYDVEAALEGRPGTDEGRSPWAGS